MIDAFGLERMRAKLCARAVVGLSSFARAKRDRDAARESVFGNGKRELDPERDNSKVAGE